MHPLRWRFLNSCGADFSCRSPHTAIDRVSSLQVDSLSYELALNVVDGRAIVRMDVGLNGFYTGVVICALLKSSYRVHVLLAYQKCRLQLGCRAHVLTCFQACPRGKRRNAQISARQFAHQRAHPQQESPTQSNPCPYILCL